MSEIQEQTQAYVKNTLRALRERLRMLDDEKKESYTAGAISGGAMLLAMPLIPIFNALDFAGAGAQSVLVTLLGVSFFSAMVQFDSWQKGSRLWRKNRALGISLLRDEETLFYKWLSTYDVPQKALESARGCRFPGPEARVFSAENEHKGVDSFTVRFEDGFYVVRDSEGRALEQQRALPGIPEVSVEEAKSVNDELWERMGA